jgi:Flp pilus assembly protein TadG
MSAVPGFLLGKAQNGMRIKLSHRGPSISRADLSHRTGLDLRMSIGLEPYYQEEGQAMVEMALLLPVLLLLVTGLLTFAVALNNYVMLIQATGVGARAIAISRGQTTDPCATASQAVSAAAPLLTAGNLSYTFNLNGTTYTGASCSSGSSTTGAAANLVQGSNAVVTVTYPCSLVVYGANYAPNCQLQAQITELIQ